MQDVQQGDWKRVAILLGAYATVIAVLFAVLVADASKQLICFGDAGVNCQMGLMNAQLSVAIGGLLPAAALVWAAHRRRHVIACVALIAVLFALLGWGVLNDAAVHGWDDLKVF